MTLRACPGSLLPLVFLLRQSQAFFVVFRHYHALERSFHFTKAHSTATAVASSSPATPAVVSAASLLRKSVIARSITMSSAGSSIDEGHGNTNEKLRERAQAMHSTMTSEGKENMLRQATRDAHNRRQAAVFNSKVAFFSSSNAVPPEQFPALRRIAEACLPTGDGADARRVVDVGCGTGALVGFLKEAGVEERDIVGVDMSSEMGSVFHERYPEASIVISEFVDFAEETVKIREKRRKKGRPAPATTTTGDDVTDDVTGNEKDGSGLTMGTVLFNAVFGNLWDQKAALQSAAAILEEGGKVVISHPLGRDFVSRLKAVDDTVVPHDLPDREELHRLVQFLPLYEESFESSPDLYLAVLRKMPHQALENVRYLRGKVSQGYGRGSKKLGIPTANLPESQFSERLRSLPGGVYFGWATLEMPHGDSEGGGGPWKCAANVGYSPTFAGQENPEKIVEGHLLGYEGGDFYGRTMRLLLVGFHRPEEKFASFPELVAAINKDVDDAAAALDEPRFAVFKDDAFFSLGTEGSGTTAPEAWSTRDFVSAMQDAEIQAGQSDKPSVDT